MKLLQEDDYFILQESGEYLLSEDLYNYTFPVSVGSFTLTATAGLYRQFKIITETVALTLTGYGAGLYRGLKLIGVSGSLALTGVAVSLIKISKLFADSISLTLTGTLTDVFKNRGIWRLPPSGTTTYSSIAKPTTAYSSVTKPTTAYNEISGVATEYTASNDMGDDLLQEDNYLILQEDEHKIKFPVNIWTNIPKY